LAEVAHPGKSIALYNLIIRALPRKIVNEADLTIKLRSKRQKSRVTISLVEFLDCATSPGKKPERIFLFFFKYLQTLVHLPQCFLLNENFKTARE
jgi:hypothetical protein